MAHLSTIFDLDNLTTHLDRGEVSRTFHPEDPYSILNYTAQAQYTRAWTTETLGCRGLIIDQDFHIVARGWPKFFNHTEVAVPKFVITTPPIVTDKMDGSLGIIYQRPDGSCAVSTRGSFMSDQAIWATQWLTVEMPGFVQPEGVTTLVEIIYPENRIVVDYGDRAELVLLGAIHTDSGADVPIWEIDWWLGARVDQHVGIGDMDKVYRFATGNDKEEDEGVVAVWYRPDGPSFRLKCKHPEYVRLHRIITGTSSKTVWRALREGNLVEVVENVPDEFHDWVREVADDLVAQFTEIEDAAYAEFDRIVADIGKDDRKAFALAVKDSPHRAFLFAHLDGKQTDDMIWKQIEPAYSKPFTDRKEEV